MKRQPDSDPPKPFSLSQFVDAFTFETSEWEERDAEMTVPADPTHPGGSQTGFYIAVADVLETHDMRGHVLSSDVSYSGEYGVGYQRGATLDPNQAVYFLPLGGQVFRPIPGAFYRIAAKHSGKVLDVGGAATGNGARVIQWDWCNGLNQKWQAVPQPDGTIAFRALHSGKFLDVKSKDMGNGAVLQQWTWLAGDNQKWLISPV